MPVLVPTDHYGTITWLGKVETGREDIRSEAIQSVDVSFEGIAGEVHAGRNRKSCVRVKTQYPEGTEIANVRQFSILSAEELAEIAAECELSEIEPEWLGATLVVEGIPDFTHVPPSSRLQAENGTCLVIDMLNAPCLYPAREIEKDKPGHGKKFKPAAEGRRGVTAWVEYPGSLAVGDRMRLHVPGQRAWQGEG